MATLRPATIDRAQALVFTGNHGVCGQCVNPFPQEVTAPIVADLQAGGAAINQLCLASGADLAVVALDMDRPTQDFTQGPAMTDVECHAAMQTGAATVEPDADILILGEMGIGNSKVAAALAAALFGETAADWVQPGTGSIGSGLTRKAAVIEARLRHPAGLASMQVLTALGVGNRRRSAARCWGRARLRSQSSWTGSVCTSAAGPLFARDARLLDHCLAGHVSAEPGHRRLFAGLRKHAVLDLNIRLGEGSGAALALGVVRAALECPNGMATFAQAGLAGG